MEEKKKQAGDEMNLLDYFVVVLKRKKFILKMTVCVTLIVGIIVFLMSDKFAAQTRFMPSQNQSSSIATAMVSQLSGLSLTGSSLGIKSPGSMYVSIMTGNTILDKVIDRYDLMKRYTTWKNSIFPFFREDCRKTLIEDIISADSDDTSGIVTVTVMEKDPKLAANMANTLVEELTSLSNLLASTEATQRKRFYEEQLTKTKENLSKAEEDLRAFQEKTGILQVDAQAQAVITGNAALRAQIAAKEVEIKVMKTFSTAQNPELQKAEEALRGLKTQLAKLEDKSGQGPDPFMPIGRMPSVGLEYVRKFREVKFAAALYENLFKMYDLAMLDEQRNDPVIQVVDKAVVPQKKAKPKRVFIIVLTAFFSFFMAVITAFILEFKEKAATHPDNSERMVLLRKYAQWRKNK